MEEGGLWDVIKAVLHEEAGDIVVAAFWRLDRTIFERLCIFAWCIWWERNKTLHGSQGHDVVTQVSFADSYLDEYRASVAMHEAVQSNNPEVVSRWTPSPHGQVKLNTDASVRIGDNYISIRLVYRYCYRVVLAAYSKRVMGYFDDDTAELLAIRDGLQLAVNWRVSVALLESDSLHAISNIPLIAILKLLF